MPDLWICTVINFPKCLRKITVIPNTQLGSDRLMAVWIYIMQLMTATASIMDHRVYADLEYELCRHVRLKSESIRVLQWFFRGLESSVWNPITNESKIVNKYKT